MILNYLGKVSRLALFEFLKSCRLFVRYPLNALITIIVMLLVFFALFQAALGIIGGDHVETINVEYTIQKFIVWTTMIMGFASVSGGIRDETLNGMIETVWMGGVPPAITLAIRGVTAIIITLTLNVVLTFLLAVFYQKLAVFTLQFAVCVLLVSMASLGVGLILGAAVVVFKEIGPGLNLLQFMMLPLFMNETAYHGSVIEVVAPGLSALRFLNGDPSANWSIVHAVSWLLVGFVLMSWAIQRSKKTAMIYQY